MPRQSNDPGYGPPPGNPAGPGRGGGQSLDDLAKRSLAPFDAAANDPAFQTPVDATDDATKARVKLVYRDLPLVTIQNTWSVNEVRGALYSHMVGIFEASGQLCDSILGDDRVTATLNSLATALFGREPRFKAADDSKAAKECLDAWTKWYPRLACDAGLRETHDYSVMMGFGHSQIVWGTTQPGLDYAPELRPWHPRFEYYDWTIRKFMAIGQDAIVPITPGNGKWLQHTPYGPYRGWIRGALRPVAEPWLLRHFGFRDMARFGEVHGNPTRKGYVPAVGDPIERDHFERSLANLGADAAIIVPRGVDGQNGDGYDYELVEAQSKAWEVHPAQIDRCDMAIVLAILMVNLTTEVRGGSYAAADVQMDVRQGGVQFYNQAWKGTLYNQLARPFAFLNFGDANLAPWTWYDVVGREEYKTNADQFQKFGTAIEVLRRGGLEFKDPEQVRRWAAERFGLDGLPDFTIKAPVSGGLGAGAQHSKLPFTDVDPATVVTVNEARSLNDLPPMSGGDVTIAEFHEDKAAEREKDIDDNAAEDDDDESDDGDDEERSAAE